MNKTKIVKKIISYAFQTTVSGLIKIIMNQRDLGNVPSFYFNETGGRHWQPTIHEASVTKVNYCTFVSGDFSTIKITITCALHKCRV